ncbi:MAG: reverse transcriptase family protein [Planctomycetota bacterium]
MGLLDFLRRRDRGLGLDELARRLGVSEADLAAARIGYREFNIPKRRGGGTRRILAPDPDLKDLQRRILRRVLALLVAHDAATGFERGRSIVTNASRHRGRAVVVRLDLRRFFESTSSKRVERFFRSIGWSRAAAHRLAELCTRDGGLPQGAPTSPRLANLVNFRLDTRLDRLATKLGATYTRYADDLTFSFPRDDAAAARSVVKMAQRIVGDEGYRLHSRKLSILRRHQQQRVTGLVVNESVNLPRSRRRWLRAVEHRHARGRGATLTDAQLQGWRAYRRMIETGGDG